MYGPPRPCKGRVRLDDAVCLNVSGLSRVDRCCGQAMMRSARVVPKKWFGQEARFFAQGLRHVDQLFRHHSPEPRSLNSGDLGRNGLMAFAQRTRARQDDPDNSCNFGREGDDNLVVVHPSLQGVEPRAETIT